MSSIFKTLAGVAFAAVLVSPAGAQGHREEHLAGNGADHRQYRARTVPKHGFSVTVVDRAGLALVTLRGDGAGLHTPEGSDRKAYTARTFRSPSAAFVKRMLDDPAAAGSKEYTRVLALGGGLPIKIGDDVIGAVGVSGLPGKDDICSQAGIDKVADQLK
jgi:uncharacterized protein GlcG (DUF336 family)